MTLRHFEQIAREIRAIADEGQRAQAAKNVSRLREFPLYLTLAQFLRMCDAN